MADLRICGPLALLFDEVEGVVCRLRKGEGSNREAREGECGFELLVNVCRPSGEPFSWSGSSASNSSSWSSSASS